MRDGIPSGRVVHAVRPYGLAAMDVRRVPLVVPEPPVAGGVGHVAFEVDGASHAVPVVGDAGRVEPVVGDVRRVRVGVPGLPVVGGAGRVEPVVGDVRRVRVEVPEPPVIAVRHMRVEVPELLAVESISHVLHSHGTSLLDRSWIVLGRPDLEAIVPLLHRQPPGRLVW